MTGRTTAGFWKCYAALPATIQAAANEKYRLWRVNPFHPSLHFKELTPGLWSVRVTLHHRALGRRRGDVVFWFWIGTHDEYDELIARY